MFVKQILEIGSGDNSIETDVGYNFLGDFELDNLTGVMSFKLPYLLPDQKNISDGSLDITRLKKYDTVNLYFKKFETDPGTVTPDQLVKIFTGYIDNIRNSKSKDIIDYEVQALGSLALANERNVDFKLERTITMSNIVQVVLQKAGMQVGIVVNENNSDIADDIIPEEDVIVSGDSSLFINIKGGTNAGDTLKSVRKDYAVIINQTGDGKVNVYTPWFLSTQNDFESWEFDFNNGNVFDLDYGDLTNHINSYIVLGFPPFFGMSIDAVAVQNNGQGYNYLTFENRSLRSDEQCEEVARNKLLEALRNYTITFKTEFNPEFKVGDTFTMIDNDRYDGTQIFMIKSIKFIIDKSDVSCTITGFNHSLTVLPEDIVLSNTGIADVDALEVKDKIPDIIGWTEGIRDL